MTMPDAYVQIAFRRDPITAEPLWHDVSDDVQWWQGVRISRRRSHELDEVQPGTMSLVLDNIDGRYTAGNDTSTHYPFVRINRPVRIGARWPVSPNKLTAVYAQASSAAAFSTNNGTLAVSATAPAGQTTSIRWNSASWVIGDLLRLGALSSASPTDAALPVTAGTTYSVSCQARRETNTVSVAVRVRWYNNTGAVISDVNGPTVALTTSFQAITFSGAAPAFAAFARVLLETKTTGTSAAILSSAWQFENAAAPTTWTDPGVDYIRYTGFIDRWPHAWANGVLGYASITATDRQKLLGRQLLGSTALTDNQLSGARVSALLTAAGVTNTDVDPGLSLLGLTGNESTQSLQALLRQAARSEAGLFFIAGDDTAVFQDRSQRQRPSVAVLTVDADQCSQDLSFLVDDALLINDATVITESGSEASATDPDSIDEYGTYSQRLETLLTTTVEAGDRALYLLGKYSEPQPRAGQISIEANSQPALWEELLASEIGQRIQITNLPSNAPTGTLDLWVEGIQDLITDQSWTFTLDPSPAVVTVSFILNDSTYGTLNNNTLGW